MTFAALSTTRLVLRPAAADDLDALWTIWREPDVRRYLFDDVPVTRQRAAEVLDACLAHTGEGLGMWTLAERGEVTILGCVGLVPVISAAEYDRRLTGGVEPIVALAPTVWGRGYAREALVAVIAYGFGTLGLSELMGVTDVPNQASDRLLRHLGFEATGECDGPRYRMRTYVLSRDRTAALRAPRSRSS